MNDKPDELTVEEKAAFAALPRESDPGQLLEERTVRSLLKQGLLSRQSFGGPSWKVQLWALNLAAALVLFVGGVATGQWLGTRALANSMVVAQQESTMQTAALVQQTGSAYVTALMMLAQVADSSTDPAVAQGREVALTALYAAARELAQLAPEDPLTLVIQDGLRRASFPSADEAAEVGLQSVVWF